METVKEIKIGNELLLTITKLGDNKYKVENNSSILIGECEPLGEYKTRLKMLEGYTRGKNGRLYKSTKEMRDNTMWFGYILEEYGFIRKSKSMNA